MNNAVRITVLVENRTSNDALRAEHGLSLLVETEAFSFVFDTGQSSAYLDNAQRLGVPLDRADAIVLSHGHYDHSGGLGYWQWPMKRLYLHPACLHPRCSGDKRRGARQVGMPYAVASLIRSNSGSVVWTDGPTEISKNIGVTGFIPRWSEHERCREPFFLDERFTVPDSIPDDQAAWIMTPDGAVVLIGCAHAGAINTLDFISERVGAERIRAVVGGLHLYEADAERVLWTAQGFNQYGVERVIVGHCTGEKTVQLLSQWCTGCVQQLTTGAIFDL